MLNNRRGHLVAARKKQPQGRAEESATIKGVLAAHREALVICADEDADGEVKITAYTKLLSNGALSRYLAQLLESLRDISNAADSGNIAETETTIGPQADNC